MFDGIDRRKINNSNEVSLTKQQYEDTEDLVEEIIEKHNEKQKTNKSWSLESLHISPALLFQIVSVVVAIITQYNMLENRIIALESQLKSSDDKITQLTEIQHDIERLKSQDAIYSEMINSIQIKMASSQNRK
jgi:hypothetical protein